MKKILKLTLITGIILSIFTLGTFTASASCPLTSLLRSGFGNNFQFSGNPFGSLGSLFGFGNNSAGNNSGCPISNFLGNGTNFFNNGNNCSPGNSCTGNNCSIGNNCSTGNCVQAPEKIPEPEAPKTQFELEKGYLYALRVDMGGESKLVVKSSNPDVATAVLRGNNANGMAVVHVRTLQAGSTTITVCLENNPSVCQTVYITVVGASDPVSPPAPPQPEPQPEPEPPQETACSIFAEEVLKLVNDARAQNNLSALALDETLCAAAEVRAEEVLRRFSHTRPDGTSCFTVLRDFGISYRVCGENIAKGFNNAQAVFNAWMNSSGHRANILNPNYTHMGLGRSGNGWGQLFVG